MFIVVWGLGRGDLRVRFGDGCEGGGGYGKRGLGGGCGLGVKCVGGMLEEMGGGLVRDLGWGEWKEGG